MNNADQFDDSTMPELIAGYADGELNAADRGRVEAWLAANPGASAELETQRRFGRHRQLWKGIPEPSEAEWRQVLLRVQFAVAAARPAEPPAGRVSRRRLLAALVAVAAAILLAIALFPRDQSQKAGPESAADEAFACAELDDVEIMRIFEADVDCLVIGEPPLRRAIVLATIDDVDGLKAAKDTDGMMPMMVKSGPNAPMVVAPMAGK
jgi:hypothetical protein